MGLREQLNQNSAAVTLAAVILLSLAMVILLATVFQQPDESPPQVYFTDDDGVSYFTDAYNRFPPFEHNGHEAALAYLFSCDGGGNPFVGYMLKYTPEAKEALDEAVQTPGDPTFTDVLQNLSPDQVLVKRPGDQEWVRRGTSAADAVTGVTCPGGDPARAVLTPD